jgi:hypothetical protein
MGRALTDAELYGDAPAKGRALSDAELYGDAPAKGRALSDAELYGDAPAAVSAPAALKPPKRTAYDDAIDAAKYVVGSGDRGLVTDIIGLLTPGPTPAPLTDDELVAAGYAPGTDLSKPVGALAQPFQGPQRLPTPTAPRPGSYAPQPTTPQPARTLAGTAGDVLNVGLKSAMAVPELAVGLADIVSGGYAGKGLEALGLDFGAAKKASDELLMSPAQQWAGQQVQQAQGVGQTLFEAVRNPSTILAAGGESLGPMGAGGVAARGIASVAPRLASIAAPLGEGITSAGSSAEQIRQETPGGLLSLAQTGLAAGSGVLTSLFSIGGGKLAHRLGIEDVDNFIAGVDRLPNAQKAPLIGQVLKGAAAEGLIEELPQSLTDQIAQNLALGKPWDKDLAQAGVMGALTGAAMGGSLPAVQRGQQLAGQARLAAAIGGAPLQQQPAVPMTDAANIAETPYAQPEPIRGELVAAPDRAAAPELEPALQGLGSILSGDAGRAGLASSLAAALGIPTEPDAATGPYAQPGSPLAAPASDGAVIPEPTPTGIGALNGNGLPYSRQPARPASPGLENAPGRDTTGAPGAAPGIDEGTESPAAVGSGLDPGLAGTTSGQPGADESQGPQELTDEELYGAAPAQPEAAAGYQHNPAAVEDYAGSLKPAEGARARNFLALPSDLAGETMPLSQAIQTLGEQGATVGFQGKKMAVFKPDGTVLTARKLGKHGIDFAQQVLPGAAKDAPAAPKSKSPSRAWRDNPLKHDLRTWGIAPELMTEFAPGPREQAIFQNGEEARRAFREGGLQLDELKLRMVEEGYLDEGASDVEVHALIQQIANGRPVFPQYGAYGTEARAAKASDNELSALSDDQIIELWGDQLEQMAAGVEEMRQWMESPNVSPEDRKAARAAIAQQEGRIKATREALAARPDEGNGPEGGARAAEPADGAAGAADGGVQRAARPWSGLTDEEIAANAAAREAGAEAEPPETILPQPPAGRDAAAAVDARQQEPARVEPAEDGLTSYSAAELKARDERIREEERKKLAADKKADDEAAAEREAKEVKARVDASVDDYELGQDADDAVSGQGALLDVESKVPPEGKGEDFMARAFTQRPSTHNSAWITLGIDPGTANNLPITQQFAKLKTLFSDRLGIKVVEAPGAIQRESVDNLLDGYHNITAMMASMGLPQNAVGLNGQLTLKLEKYNAKRGYLGAYDPSTRTIHMPGRSNSFGHEWMHALDHFMTSIVRHPGDDDLFSFIVRKTGAKVDDRLQGAFAELMNTIFHDRAETSWKVLQLQVEASARTKAGEPTPSAKRAERELNAILAGTAKGSKGIKETEYSANVAAFDPGRAKYWQNPAEMLARAFEAYIASQRPTVPLNEFVSKPMDSYLNNADERFAMTFPKEEERTQIFTAFTQFFDELRQSNELGTGEQAEMPIGEGVFDPDRWDSYPANETAWQRIVQSEKLAFRQWRLPGWAESKGDPAWNWSKGAKGVAGAAKAEALDQGRRLTDGLLATFASQRGHMNSLYRRYKSPAINRLRKLLYHDRGSGQYAGATFHEATSTRIRAKLNEMQGIQNKHRIGELTKEDNQALRLMMISAETMLGNKDVVAQLKKMNISLPAERINQLSRMASDLRGLMNQEFYYNRKAGIDVGYARNGYLPRLLNYEAFFEDMEGFEQQAYKAYGAQFDRDVGKDPKKLDEDGFNQAASELRAAYKYPDPKAPHVSSTTIDGLAQLTQLRGQLTKIEKAIAASDDPAELLAKRGELRDALDELMAELLPAMRHDWSALAAHDWRTRLNTTQIADYDTMGPDSKYTQGRTLPPEADVFMQDFYKADPLDAIAEYLERSTRRVQYANMFGVNSSTLQEILDQARDEGVSKADRALLMGMVNNATGRENHSAVPGPFIELTNKVNSVLTMYLLGRAVFSSLTEPVIAFGRTGNAADLFRPFGAMVQDVFKTASAMERRRIANILGLVTAPHSDALMTNRLTGESYSKQQSLRMGRFFERTLLAPMTRAQQRAMITVGQQYLLSLTDKPNHAPSQAELRELGIPTKAQAGFAAWLEEMDGGLPTPADLIDKNTNELNPYGVMYGTALKRFSDQVIMEPSKMDRPRLASNPVGRFAFGIMSFSYTFWNQVQKPFIKQVGRNLETLARATVGKSNGGNAGRSAADALLGLSLAGASMATFYAGQVLSTIIRAALLDSDKWDEKDKEGELAAWIAELAFWRSGFAGPLDPLVQAVRGIKYQRDFTSLTAGPQFGSLFQNVQDIAGLMVNNAPGTNTNERKAAKAFYNLTIGPAFTWAAAAAPGGAVIGPALGMLATAAGSGAARDYFADKLAGPELNKKTEKRVKQADGSTIVRDKTPQELRATEARKRDKERKTQREAAKQAMLAGE